jgi:SAM-dependent methyltransferase
MGFDAEYHLLKRSGHPGWGWLSYDRRLDGWVKTITRLRADAKFPAPPSHLLELGCGNGMISSLFAEQGYAVEGVEISSNAVLWARELFEDANLQGEFRQGSVCSMPFYGNCKFDAVIDGNCFHCLIGSDRAKCLAEVQRVLRPGGTFIISSMCGEPKSEDALARFDPKSRCLFKDGQPYRTLIGADDIAREIGDAGFRVVWRQVNENAWWDHLTLMAVVQKS